MVMAWPPREYEKRAVVPFYPATIFDGPPTGTRRR
jgi:hypothetical protein